MRSIGVYRDMIEFVNVSKTYIRRKNENIHANVDINFTINKGDFVGIFGANGSGKSTLVKQLVGLTSPSTGKINIAGVKNEKDRAVFKETIGYMSQASSGAIWKLKINEVIETVAALKGISRKSAVEGFRKLKAELEIDDNIDHAVFGHLSGGQRKLVSFIIAALGNQPILVLDEPSNELDPKHRALLWSYINKYNAMGNTVILVTHNLNEVANHISRVLLVEKGQIVIDEVANDLLMKYANSRRLTFSIGKDSLISSLSLIKEAYPNYAVKTFGDNSITLIGEISDTEIMSITKNLPMYSVSKVTMEDICFFSEI